MTGVFDGTAGFCRVDDVERDVPGGLLGAGCVFLQRPAPPRQERVEQFAFAADTRVGCGALVVVDRHARVGVDRDQDVLTRAGVRMVVFDGQDGECDVSGVGEGVSVRRLGHADDEMPVVAVRSPVGELHSRGLLVVGLGRTSMPVACAGLSLAWCRGCG